MSHDLERELARRGFLRSRDGCLLTGAAERLFVAWQGLLGEALGEFADGALVAPAFIDDQVLRDSAYLEHFPQLVFSAGNALHPQQEARPLTPAACLHFYPLLRDQALGDEGRAVVIRGRCARYEDARWAFPFRLPSFEMVELVGVGNAARVGALCERARARVIQLFEALEMTSALEPATDSFYLGDGDGAQVVQKLRGLKTEMVVSAGGERVAVGSINRHEAFFGERFAIRTDGSPASSFCIAFGLERLVACGLSTWGGEPSDWPIAVAKHVALS